MENKHKLAGKMAMTIKKQKQKSVDLKKKKKK